MAIQFRCTGCNALLSVDEKYLGKKIQCGKCKQIVIVQAASAAPPPAIPPGTAQNPIELTLAEPTPKPIELTLAEPTPKPIELTLAEHAPKPMATPKPIELTLAESAPQPVPATAIQTEAKPLPPAPTSTDSPAQTAPAKGPKPPPLKTDVKGRPDRRSERKRESSPLKWIAMLAAAGFFVVAFFGCIGVLGWFALTSGAMKPAGPGQLVQGKDAGRKDGLLVPPKMDDRKSDDNKDAPPPPEPVVPIAAQFPPVNPQILAIKPAALADERATRMLPATMDDIVAGGGGRFLLFNLPSLRKVGMFDVNEGKIVHYFPAAGDGVKIAAGLTKLVILFSDTKIIQRWDLFTKEKELTMPLPLNNPRYVSMGSASQGPVLVMAGHEGGSPPTFLSLANFKSISLSKNGGLAEWVPAYMRVSANGTVYSCWNTGSPAGLNSHVIVGNEIKSFRAHSSAGHLVPGPDGKILYTACGMFTNETQPIGGAVEHRIKYLLPAVQGNFYLSVNIVDRSEPQKKYVGVSIYISGDARPVLDVDCGLEGFNQWDREQFGNDKRVQFIPDANLLVVVPTTNDRLELFRVNIDESLEKSGIDYLYVTSRAPTEVQRGTKYEYKLAVKSKKGGLKYKLDAGPEGMKLTPDGIVAWNVAAIQELTEETVLLTVTDAAGQEVFHTFRLRVIDAPEP